MLNCLLMRSEPAYDILIDNYERILSLVCRHNTEVIQFKCALFMIKLEQKSHTLNFVYLENIIGMLCPEITLADNLSFYQASRTRSMTWPVKPPASHGCGFDGVRASERFRIPVPMWMAGPMREYIHVAVPVADVLLQNRGLIRFNSILQRVTGIWDFVCICVQVLTAG